MARKIFVSYKHEDKGVQPLTRFGALAVRDYVDLLERYFSGDHIYKGEKDNEDLGSFKDETIESHLRDKIFDSSVTIVLISKNMKNQIAAEKDQWIPWEISYSLREKTREERSSAPNAILAVVLPDEFGSYEYFVSEDHNCMMNCRTWKNDSPLIFEIIRKNMFNLKTPKIGSCNVHGQIHTGNDHSYIHPATWSDFVSRINWYINLAASINENIEDYEIVKTIY